MRHPTARYIICILQQRQQNATRADFKTTHRWGNAPTATRCRSNTAAKPSVRPPTSLRSSPGHVLSKTRCGASADANVPTTPGWRSIARWRPPAVRTPSRHSVVSRFSLVVYLSGSGACKEDGPYGSSPALCLYTCSAPDVNKQATYGAQTETIHFQNPGAMVHDTDFNNRTTNTNPYLQRNT